MPKRVFIVHRWDGSPDSDWYSWLKKTIELEKGFTAYILEMPDPFHPKMDAWIDALKNAVGKPDENTYFVGHSIGCQTIIRYLERIKSKVGGAVFVAGWVKLSDEAMPTERDVAIARPWIYEPIKIEKVKEKTKNFTAIFSDDDPYVPLENIEFFKKLGAKIVIQKGKGHYTADDVKTPFEVLKELMDMVK